MAEMLASKPLRGISHVLFPRPSLDQHCADARSWMPAPSDYNCWLVTRLIILSQSTGGNPTPPHFPGLYMWCVCHSFRSEVAYILFGKKDWRSDLMERRPIGGFLGFVLLANNINDFIDLDGVTADLGVGAGVGGSLQRSQIVMILFANTSGLCTRGLGRNLGHRVVGDRVYDCFTRPLLSHLVFPMLNACS